MKAVKALLILFVLTFFPAVSSANEIAVTKKEGFHYLSIPFDELQILEGAIPTLDRKNVWRLRRKLGQAGFVIPYVSLDQKIEAYFFCEESDKSYSILGIKHCLRNRKLTVKVPVTESRKLEISGRLVLPKKSFTELVSVKFDYPDSKIKALSKRSAQKISKEEFQKARNHYYGRLISLQVPGLPWFRGKIDQPNFQNVLNQRRPGRIDSRTNNDLFDMFTGAKAIGENLQLDRILPFDDQTESTVELSSLTGITVKEYDWSALLEDKKPELDYLSSYIPEDQYSLFFPSYSSFKQMIENSKQDLVPVFDLFETRAEDHRSLERYEEQLGLSLDDLPALIGDVLIESVAITSSDPYIKSGTDLALLFQTSQPERLFELIRLKVRESIITKAEGVVAISNSKLQLEKIKKVVSSNSKSMMALDEYRYFRSIYPKVKDETAFLMVTDAAIRKWAGPKWRIVNSRRLRALAVMNKVHSEHFEDYLKNPGKQPVKVSEHGLRDLIVSKGGVKSELYGSQSFLTPISELGVEKVSQREADMYKRYRDSYQKRWAAFFDPIGVQFKISDNVTKASVTVMPLIEQSSYSDFMELIGGKQISFEGLSDNDILSLAFTLNKESELFRIGDNMLAGVGSSLTNPLGWLGDSVRLRITESSFWESLESQSDVEQYLEDNFLKSPIGLEVDVKDKLQLAAFLTSLRAIVEQTVPGTVIWENKKHGGQQYVKVTAPNLSLSSKDSAVYYAIRSSSLLVTFNEDSIKGISAGVKGSDSSKMENADSHVALDVSNTFIKAMKTIFGESYQASVRDICFKHLPILTEWKKLQPDLDPVEVHQKFSSTRLRCPGGYSWNEEWQTMESVKFGHPVQLKELSRDLGPVESFERGRFQLSFENDGLRSDIEFIKSSDLAGISQISDLISRDKKLWNLTFIGIFSLILAFPVFNHLRKLRSF